MESSQNRTSETQNNVNPDLSGWKLNAMCPIIPALLPFLEKDDITNTSTTNDDNSRPTFSSILKAMNKSNASSSSSSTAQSNKTQSIKRNRYILTDEDLMTDFPIKPKKRSQNNSTFVKPLESNKPIKRRKRVLPNQEPTAKTPVILEEPHVSEELATNPTPEEPQILEESPKSNLPVKRKRDILRNQEPEVDQFIPEEPQDEFTIEEPLELNLPIKRRKRVLPNQEPTAETPAIPEEPQNNSTREEPLVPNKSSTSKDHTIRFQGPSTETPAIPEEVQNVSTYGELFKSIIRFQKPITPPVVAREPQNDLTHEEPFKSIVRLQKPITSPVVAEEPQNDLTHEEPLVSNKPIKRKRRILPNQKSTEEDLFVLEETQNDYMREEPPQLNLPNKRRRHILPDQEPTKEDSVIPEEPFLFEETLEFYLPDYLRDNSFDMLDETEYEPSADDLRAPKETDKKSEKQAPPPVKQAPPPVKQAPPPVKQAPPPVKQAPQPKKQAPQPKKQAPPPKTFSVAELLQSFKSKTPKTTDTTKQTRVIREEPDELDEDPIARRRREMFEALNPKKR